MVIRNSEELATFNYPGLPPFTLYKTKLHNKVIYENISKAAVYVCYDIDKEEFEKLMWKVLRIHTKVANGSLKRPCRVYVG